MSDIICAVYILTNQKNTVLYTGVTSNLPGRVWQHKNKTSADSFSARYRLKKLVWYETTPNILAAIAREKEIKGGSRKKKLSLVNKMNPDWEDLSIKILRMKE